MAQPVYTEADLSALIKGLESEFSKEFAKSGVLSKSEDGEKKDKPSEEKPKEEGKEPSEKPAEQKPAEAKPEEKPAPAMASPEEDHGYDDEDMQHMHKMYGSMSKGELKAHHDAVKNCLDALSGHAGGPTGAPAPSSPAQKLKPETMGKAEHSDGLIEDCPPKGPAGPTSEASKDSKNLKNAMSKNEEHTRESGGKIEKTPGPKGSPGAKSEASKDQGNLDDMEKSEKTGIDLVKSELEAEKAKNADLQKNMAAVQEFLTKFVGKISAPKGKAITEIGTLNKSEDGAAGSAEMSKAEVTAKLLAKSQDPKTSPQDRQAINNYYLTGANVSTISHLLK